MIEQRKQPFVIDEQKFVTQKAVTYILLALFFVVVLWTIVVGEDAERSTVLQTVINLTILAAGYWLGASKAAADNSDAIGKIMKPQSDAMSRIAEAQPVKPEPSASPNATEVSVTQQLKEQQP